LVNIGQQKQALYMKINVFLHLEVTLKMWCVPQPDRLPLQSCWGIPWVVTSCFYLLFTNDVDSYQFYTLHNLVLSERKCSMYTLIWTFISTVEQMKNAVWKYRKHTVSDLTWNPLQEHFQAAARDKYWEMS
jgi:hypothetical protein